MPCSLSETRLHFGRVAGLDDQQLGADLAHAVFEVEERHAAGLDGRAAMLDVFHVGVFAGGVDERRRRRRRSSFRRRGPWRRGRDAGDMQDGLLVALALPVLDVHVGQLEHRRRADHEVLAEAVDRHERDHVDAGRAVLVFDPRRRCRRCASACGRSSICRVRAPGPAVTALSPNAPSGSSTVSSRRSWVRTHAAAAFLGAPAEDGVVPDMDEVGPQPGLLLVRDGPDALRRRAIHEDAAQAVAERIAAQVGREGVQVAAFEVDVFQPRL